MPYHAHWRVSAPPFENLPDPSFYVPSGKHEDARQRLLYGVQARKGVIMITGEIGCGKSLLSRDLIQNLPKSQYDIALMVNPSLPATDFFTEVLYQFGLDTNGPKVDMLHRMNDHLLANHREKVATVLIVDEAQSILEDQVFEELRLMLNFQLNDLFLMTLILLGQPELKERVERIPQLNQRIAIRYHLAPFNADETYQYIRSRLKLAGAITEIFTKDAAFEIFQRTGGVSRLINTLCDACLMLGAQEQLPQIDLSVVKRASRVL